MDRNPALARIDRLRPTAPRFVETPGAAELERQARRLTGEYRGDAAWLTGRVPAASLATVVEALERLTPGYAGDLASQWRPARRRTCSAQPQSKS